MNGTEKSAHWWVITRSIVLWGVLGLLFSAVICYVTPKRFASQAVLEANEKVGRSVKLSPLHAAYAIRLARDESHDDPPDANDIADVCDHTRIRASEGIVKIEVKNTNKVFARDLAMELTSIFRSMDEEESLAKFPSNLQKLTENQKELLEVRSSLTGLMNDAVEATVGIRNFRAIHTLSEKGQPEADALWKSADFQRQWIFFNEISEKLAPETKSQLPKLTIVGFPMIAEKVASPDVNLYLRSGLFIGLAFGGFMGARRVSKMGYSTGKTDETGVTKCPEFDQNPQESHQGLARAQRESTPEEEW